MTGSSLNAARRRADLEALSDGLVVDVLVVGGGITGAGVALDAASRGLSVAMLERRDLAHGTSRWSSKLIHGGLRYLESYDFGLAWESARERARLIGVIAPHLVRPLPFVIPIPHGTGPKALRTQAGLRVADGLRIGARTSRHDLPPSRRISVHEARRLAPALSEDGLRAALLLWDGQLDDDARLVLAVARTAAAHGARVVTYAEVTALRAGGADARDVLTGETFSVRARHTVVAAGVWSGALSPSVELRPSKGSHLLVPAERLGDPRAAVNVPAAGGRSSWVLSIPRGDGLVAIGLTDIPFEGPVPDEPTVDAAEEAELLAHASAVYDTPLGPEDVVGRYAGLRPLLAGEGPTADLSRRHAVVEDPDSGALMIVGGKLTTYRAMAQDAVDRLTDRRCVTASLPLVGAAPRAELARVAAPARLVRRYGAEAARVAERHPGLLEPIAPGVCPADLVWAIEHEGAMCADDIVHRRTRAGLVPERAAAVRDAVARWCSVPAGA